MTIRYDFTGRTAIVTGASKGIGRAIAERLTEAGATVHNWDIAPAAHQAIHGHVVDVTSREAIAAALAATTALSPRVDILVNNAGGAGATGPTLDADPDAWRHTIELNLMSVFEVSRQVAPVMQRAGYGRIVNIASLAGKEGTPGLCAYSTAKAGVIAFTKSFAKELASQDIRVNAIAPGGVETDLLATLPDETVATMLAKVPIGRFGTVDEIATLALFLACEACALNTGVTFDASGGRATY